MQSSRANDTGGHRDVSVTKTAILEVDRTPNDLQTANDPGPRHKRRKCKDSGIWTMDFFKKCTIDFVITVKLGKS